MSLKNYLNKWVSLPYYQLLLKRHKSLLFIPLGLFFCVLFLFLLLDGTVETMILFLIPFAVIIVPTMALILFKPYTKKGDVAYLASIPLTRTQLFVTTYLSGITIIETNLWIMVFITFMNNTDDLLPAMLTFISLGVIYFTLACLGCMMSGHTAKQLMNMGVICFAPLGLYLLSRWSMMELTFGNISTSINNSLLMLICPLASAAEFLSDLRWPYFYVHMALVVGAFLLCLYLMRRRPLERTEQNMLFKNVDRWIVQPIIYLNIAYLIFNILLNTILSHQHYYDAKYYMSVILLLVGVSLLVGLLMSIWSSKSIQEIFGEIPYQGILVVLSVAMMFIPLWQTEKARITQLEEIENIYIQMPMGSHYSWVQMSKDDVVDFLEKASENRSLFLNASDIDYSRIATIHIGYSQRYYFYLDEADENTLEFIEKVSIQHRQSQDYWVDFRDPYLLIEGEVYDASSIRQAIEKTFAPNITETFVNELIIDDTFYDKQDMWASYVTPYYIHTLSHLDYYTWLDQTKADSKVVISKDEWAHIESIVEDAIFHMGDYPNQSLYLDSIIDYVRVESVDYSENWVIESVSEDQIKVRVGFYSTILEDCELETFTLFKDTEYSFSLNIELNKVDGQWQPTFTGVYY